MKADACPICNASMHPGLKSWHWQCPDCGYEKADFQSTINQTNSHQNIDEHHREIGLRALRSSNFQKLVDAIVEKGVSSGRLLDVGCAHGWFLDIANSKFSTLGIEPDEQVYSKTIKRGISVRQGFFPDALSEEERFAVIVFNDVFEHIPNMHSTLLSCRTHLLSNGVLVLNLPNSSGVFYKVSRFLCKLGLSNFFERLWQKNLPSPHLHYFNTENLKKLLRTNGFEVVGTGILPSVRLKGLCTRISYTGHYSILVRLLIFFAVISVLPILRILPSDITYIISRKVDIK